MGLRINGGKAINYFLKKLGSPAWENATIGSYNFEVVKDFVYLGTSTAP